MNNCQICKKPATHKLEDKILVCGNCAFQMNKEAFFSYRIEKI